MISRGVKVKCSTLRKVVILSFTTTIVKVIGNLMMHSKYLNVVVKPIIRYSDHITMARSYGELTPGGDKNNVCLKKITLPRQTAVGEINAANVILPLLAPQPTEDKPDKG